MNDQEILSSVGQTLYRQIPAGADKVVFWGYSYGTADRPDVSYRISFFRGETLVPTTMDTRIDYGGLEQAVGAIMALRSTERFSSTPFNHFRFALTIEGKMSFGVAEVPQEDSWAGVYMKRISEMTEAEAKAEYIPKADWQKRVEMFKDRSGGTAKV